MAIGSRRRIALLVGVAAAVVTLDAIAKRVVQQNVDLGEKHEIIPGLLVLTHVQNTGAAYGLLTGQRWLLVVTAAVIAAATPLLMRALPTTGRWAWSGPVLTGMIIGGAAGNLVERARLGYVTDFVQTPPIELFQVFNVADASISVAITALLALTFLVREPAELAPPVVVGAAAGDAATPHVAEPEATTLDSDAEPDTPAPVAHGAAETPAGQPHAVLESSAGGGERDGEPGMANSSAVPSLPARESAADTGPLALPHDGDQPAGGAPPNAGGSDDVASIGDSPAPAAPSAGRPPIAGRDTMPER